MCPVDLSGSNMAALYRHLSRMEMPLKQRTERYAMTVRELQRQRAANPEMLSGVQETAPTSTSRICLSRSLFSFFFSPDTSAEEWNQSGSG